MPLQATSGAASYDAFGGGVPVEPVYIEQIFSTYLYTGTSANRSIINNIDLAGKGGLVWIKTRSEVWEHYLADTVRGTSKASATNNTSPESTGLTNGLTSFNSNGFSLGIDTDTEAVNRSPKTYASWTFREQPKFFDVVTYTGNGSSTQTISHNLGVTPGCIMVKKTSGTSNWSVYHRSLTAGSYVKLNLTDAQAADSFMNGANAPTSTTFTAQLATSDGLNANGATYVAYIFAHDAGGFGLTGTDNVISCGSFTTDINGNFSPVTLGYEPQWLMFKRSSGTDNWVILDNMRGIPTSSEDTELKANLTNAETTTIRWADLTSTGFKKDGGLDASSTYIYIAIRRGPMKVPTTGTSVFSPLALNNNTGTVNTTGFPIDLQMQFYRDGGIGDATSQWVDRLRGFSSTTTQTGPKLSTVTTAAETTTALGTLFNNTGFSTSQNWANYSIAYWNFNRAPGFFDEVCYTGNDTANIQTHNLKVKPELIISKNRSTSTDPNWGAWSAADGVVNHDIGGLSLNSNAAAAYINFGWSSGFTTTTFRADLVTDLGGTGKNQNGTTYVAYLFASCPGVSKVGSYTGTATTKQIDCGFTGGARFVLIKRTDSTGDWYVWDSARGIVAGNDPYLLLNSTAAEVTNTDYVDTYSAGFELTSTAPAALNASGGSYIFLAIA